MIDFILFVGSVSAGLGFGWCVQCFHGTDVLTVIRNASSTF
jgi:hypothetical protein